MNDYKCPENPNTPERPEESYPHFVKGLFKTGFQILTSWGIPAGAITKEAAHKMSMIHAVIGIAGEAGELIDAIKKPCMYNKDPDFKNIREELGDNKFYKEALIQELNKYPAVGNYFDEQEIETANRIKLDKRYKNGYSDKAAQERADKRENSIPDIPRAMPRSWTDIVNWSAHKIIKVDVGWLTGFGLTPELTPEEINHWVDPHTQDVYFCGSAPILESFVMEMQLAEEE